MRSRAGKSPTNSESIFGSVSKHDATSECCKTLRDAAIKCLSIRHLPAYPSSYSLLFVHPFDGVLVRVSLDIATEIFRARVRQTEAVLCSQPPRQPTNAYVISEFCGARLSNPSGRGTQKGPYEQDRHVYYRTTNLRFERAASRDLRGYIRCLVLCQSARKFSSPISVSGCLRICLITLNGNVATWAPASAARSR